jgi:dTDP-4-amino-4,6-dideoxygalactose transaminase
MQTLHTIETILSSGYLVAGRYVQQFETEFACYHEAAYGVAAFNGTCALHAALLASGIGPGDEVITTPFSFIASTNCIRFVGAHPIFVDIDPQTYNIDPNQIKAKITPQTKALLIVHLYGQPCAMDPIREICEHHNLFLIEDACQAHGAMYRGHKVGAMGDIGCFSFYATKNLAMGEGGIILTNNASLAERARILVNQGQDAKYHHTMLGYNFRMTEIQAAIGLRQLQQLDAWNTIRQRNARHLTAGLESLAAITPPYTAPDVHHVFHQYVIQLTQRDQLQRFLHDHDIQTSIHYPLAIHQQPLYRDMYSAQQLPIAEAAATQVLSLPVHPAITPDNIQAIIEHVTHFCKQI